MRQQAAVRAASCGRSPIRWADNQLPPSAHNAKALRAYGVGGYGRGVRFGWLWLGFPGSGEKKLEERHADEDAVVGLPEIGGARILVDFGG